MTAGHQLRDFGEILEELKEAGVRFGLIRSSTCILEQLI
jgi:hypothetical protein